MIQQETAYDVWICYREIQTAKKILEDMEKQKKQDLGDLSLKDAFGRRKNLQLGVPMGDNAHRLFDVSPELARSVIIAHIAIKEAKLVELNERAHFETAIAAIRRVETPA